MRRPQASVVVSLLALAVLLPMRACLAQQAQPAAAPAAAPALAAPVEVKPEGDDLAAQVQQYQAMGLDEKTALMMAMMNSDEGDMSAMLPLLMMARGGGGNQGDMMGILFFSQMMRGAQSGQATVVQLPGNVVLVIDRGVAYKIDTTTMKVLGQVSYPKRPKLSLSALAIAPAMNRAREKAMQASCLSNVKELCQGIISYANDYDMVLPGEKWADDIQPYIRGTEILACPARPETKVGYVFNKALLKQLLNQLTNPSNTIMVFEAQMKGGATVGTADDVPPEGVHDGGICVGFADGHCMWMDVNSAMTVLKQPLK